MKVQILSDLNTPSPGKLVSILSFDHQVLSLVNSVDNHLETPQTQLEVRTILSKTDVVEGHVKKTFLNGFLENLDRRYWKHWWDRGV